MTYMLFMLACLGVQCIMVAPAGLNDVCIASPSVTCLVSIWIAGLVSVCVALTSSVGEARPVPVGISGYRRKSVPAGLDGLAVFREVTVRWWLWLSGWFPKIDRENIRLVCASRL